MTKTDSRKIARTTEGEAPPEWQGKLVKPLGKPLSMSEYMRGKVGTCQSYEPRFPFPDVFPTDMHSYIY